MKRFICKKQSIFFTIAAAILLFCVKPAVALASDISSTETNYENAPLEIPSLSSSPAPETENAEKQDSDSTDDSGSPFPLEIAGVTYTPNQIPQGIQFAYEGTQDPGGRVQIFIRNTAPDDSKKQSDTVNIHVLKFNDNEPKRNVFAHAWAWEDSAAEWPETDTVIPPGVLTSFTFNSLSPYWVDTNSVYRLEFTDWINSRKNTLNYTIPSPDLRISSLAFLSTGVDPLRPDSLVFYVENQSEKHWKVVAIRIYQPYNPQSFRLLKEIAALEDFSSWPQSKIVAPEEKIALIANTPSHLKLTTAVIEVVLVNPERTYEKKSLWEKVRVRRESFDIGAGWISAEVNGTNILTHEPWLKTLKFLHINTANIQSIPGYTDQTQRNGLYTKYPIKIMGPMQPLPQYDTDTMLPRIHSAETLGNVQDEINNCSPQDAMELLRVYEGFRIPTSLILTDPWKWRDYAGISDFQHFNVTRLAVPNLFERWDSYSRWETPILWGAPLETIGALARNLRDINRPLSCAAWIQGPFDGWLGTGERNRLAPTPDELRSLAWHALSSRVSSIHWFNLNISSLVKYRDLMEPIQKINREALLLEIFFQYGDSWEHKSVMTQGEKPRPNWELSSIICPRGTLLCALDTAYEERQSPLSNNRNFYFKRPREAVFNFSLPLFQRNPLDVFRVDADGLYNISYQVTQKGVEITDKASIAAIYVATHDKTLRKELEKRRLALIAKEKFYKFDPIHERKDFNILKELAIQTGKFTPDDEPVEEFPLDEEFDLELEDTHTPDFTSEEEHKL